ncbi:MAG: hypothetical protein WD317_11945 [Balneolaceae bacterium]
MEISVGKKTSLFKGASMHGGIILLSIYLLCALLILFIFMISGILDIPYEHFTAEPAVIYNAHPFLGLASNIGVLMWCAAAAICFFTYASSENRYSGKESLFFFCSALLTTLLLFDDFFMLHEAIFPWYLGLQEETTYILYGIVVLIYLSYFRQQLLDSDYVFLAVAFIFLGLSVAADSFLPQYGLAYLVEDSFKLFGIATWLFYYAGTSRKHIRRSG